MSREPIDSPIGRESDDLYYMLAKLIEKAKAPQVVEA